MFHFRSWITFGVNLGDLLQLERAFEGDREHQLAAEAEAVFIFRVFLGDGRDLFVLLEDLFDLLGTCLRALTISTPSP